VFERADGVKAFSAIVRWMGAFLRASMLASGGENHKGEKLEG